jgi:hypothetical protein
MNSKVIKGPPASSDKKHAKRPPATIPTQNPNPKYMQPDANNFDGTEPTSGPKGSNVQKKNSLSQ